VILACTVLIDYESDNTKAMAMTREA